MGLLGTMAATAAIAGTAQAVRGRVARRQSENFARRLDTTAGSALRRLLVSARSLEISNR